MVISQIFHVVSMSLSFGLGLPLFMPISSYFCIKGLATSQHSIAEETVLDKAILSVEPEGWVELVEHKAECI